MLNIKTEDRKRVLYWDNIKGLLIALVVFAHCLYEYRNQHYIGFIVLAIYYVHMPAFIFISGFFSKSEQSRRSEAIIKNILSYLFVISIYIAADVYRGKTPHILSAYRSEWYLMALIIMRLAAPCLSKKKWILPWLIGFGLIAGYWPDLGGNSTLSIKKVVMFFPFFMAGFLTDKKFENKIRRIRFSKVLGLILFCLSAAAIILSHKFLGIEMVDVLPFAYKSNNLICAFRRLIVYTIAADFIIAMVFLSPDVSIPFLTKAGKNSFSIFLIHRPLTVIFEKVFRNSTSVIQIIASLIFTVLALTILGSDSVSKILNRFLDNCVIALIGNKKRTLKIALYLFLTLVLVIPAAAAIYRAH